MRVLVLWNACHGLSPEEDARWVEGETEKLRGCAGVRDMALHRVQSAALRHPRAWDWCLELTVDGPPNAVVRAPGCAAFLADLRLLGTRPSVLVLPEMAAA